jgi:serine/threonine protein kinase
MSEKTFSLKFNVPIFKMDNLSANFSSPLVKNENVKLFDGVYDGLGPVSILTLYNIERNIDAFYKISNQINIFVNMNIPYLAKLFGIVVDKEKFCLIFERISCSLESKLKSKSIEEKEKFRIILEVMEVLLHLHEAQLRTYDLRPSNIFLNENGDVRFIYPLGIIKI